jgi:large subunit ribosomal protein L13
MNQNMNKSFLLRVEDSKPNWHVIDAEGQILGRLATQIADLLRGKGKPTYTPHTISGDYVVVINAEKVVLSGNKMESKLYTSYSGWVGGKKELTAKQVFVKNPTTLLEHAVEGMLPKNKISRRIIKNLKLYVGPNHPHAAQIA